MCVLLSLLQPHITFIVWSVACDSELCINNKSFKCFHPNVPVSICPFPFYSVCVTWWFQDEGWVSMDSRVVMKCGRNMYLIYFETLTGKKSWQCENIVTGNFTMFCAVFNWQKPLIVTVKEADYVEWGGGAKCRHLSTKLKLNRKWAVY